VLKFTGQPADEETWVMALPSLGQALTIPANGLEGLSVSFQTVPNGDYVLTTQAEDVYGQESNILTNTVTVSN
jgi:hypothetical protein